MLLEKLSEFRGSSKNETLLRGLNDLLPVYAFNRTDNLFYS